MGESDKRPAAEFDLAYYILVLLVPRFELLREPQSTPEGGFLQREAGTHRARARVKVSFGFYPGKVAQRRPPPL